MSQTPRSRLTRAVQASPRDRAFLRTFAGTLVVLLVAIALLVRVTDPLAAFGTGLLPPIVSVDRDYKASLYRARTPGPEIVLLGSSRIKTLRPECVSALTGRPAFNFGVNAGVAEDFLAIFRFMRSQPGFRVREILLGADPEAFTGDPSFGRALAQSRALSPFVSQVRSDPERLWTDLWSQEAVFAAVRSGWHYGFDSEKLPQEALAPDGSQTRPLLDHEIRSGHFPQQSAVLASSHAVRFRYLAGTHLSPGRLAQLHEFLEEAYAAGVLVTAFVPPVHPALSRDAAGTALPHLGAELVAFLRSAERRALVRYVETRSLSDFRGDSTHYYDALHMTADNADRLLTALYNGRGRCAVQ
jgi:hypothetical protein